MKGITVSVDEETHRFARMRAAELGTSVSALVRSYLKSLVNDTRGDPTSGLPDGETERERWNRNLREVIAKIHKAHPNFRMADNLPREELYDRARAREEAEAACIAEDEGIFRTAGDRSPDPSVATPVDSVCNMATEKEA